MLFHISICIWYSFSDEGKFLKKIPQLVTSIIIPDAHTFKSNPCGTRPELVQMKQYLILVLNKTDYS